ncbi:type I-B CRISPR-associated protein Cas5b (plasmid) [Fusobacteria bacterium ZRK30]|nr:type I-B CRISPR-associated protein Cas5b [Fusobacteria bacterium ZRK30]
MEVLKFNLRGRTAFFKKPDVNTHLYFTYGSIHKMAVLGILGAMMGMGGYNQQNETKSKFPEFYEKLKDLKISIVPKNEKGYIPKKVQVFNNSVGYASKEQGGNLIVKEQWLEAPEWDIYVIIDGDEINKELKRRLEEFDFEFIPYLGKNDHFADISSVKCFNIGELKEIKQIESYFPKSILGNMKSSSKKKYWKVEEVLPVGIEGKANQYIYEKVLATNFEVEIKENESIYKVDEKTLYFI